ncbi:MAG: SMP-30/gluconolactonase/LRE family protein [Acidobacteriota bacterium]|nr:MAG: SMP-30/gluconolactonase/LRE family protein [Acidobacteriota bacterium]
MFREQTRALMVMTALVLTGCTAGNVDDTITANHGPRNNRESVAETPTWTFSPDMIFPANRSLKRPEDGIALADGRLIVADQSDGLRLVSQDGSTTPFGKMKEAGYSNDPPDDEGGANGVSLDPTGKYILVSDVYKGGIYRVDAETEATEKIYQHMYGVNAARQDSNGGVWFTQSTRNAIDKGSQNLWRSVAVPTPDGALFYLAPKDVGVRLEPIRLEDGFLFANGLALDEKDGYLYLAEMFAGRILRYRLDVPAGKVSDKTTFYADGRPIDNIELDGNGRLWMALPLQNEIVSIDIATKQATSVFRVSTPKSESTLMEIEVLMREGKPWLELFTSDVWDPAPGAITGMILSPNNGPVYVTGLGNAVIKLER